MDDHIAELAELFGVDPEDIERDGLTLSYDDSEGTELEIRPRDWIRVKHHGALFWASEIDPSVTTAVKRAMSAMDAYFAPISTADVVPTLADLDPNDPRLLPDGSRWVDAMALRLVCLHVAGLGGAQ